MKLKLACVILIWLAACQAPERKETVSYGDPGSKDVAYLNKPRSLYVFEPIEIQLTLGGNITESEIRKNFEGLEGQVWTNIVTVGPFLTAKLSTPPNLADIQSVDEIVRKYSRDVSTTWRWYLTPKKTGQIPISLELYVFEDKSDGPVKTYRAIRENWIVDARGVNWIRYHLSEIEPMRVAVWTFMGGVAGVLGFFGFSGWKRASGRRASIRKSTKQVERNKQRSL